MSICGDLRFLGRPDCIGESGEGTLVVLQLWKANLHLLAIHIIPDSVFYSITSSFSFVSQNVIITAARKRREYVICYILQE